MYMLKLFWQLLEVFKASLPNKQLYIMQFVVSFINKDDHWNVNIIFYGIVFV